jgi:hypothetical protein
MNSKWLSILIAGWMMLAYNSTYAQFSPGDLSRAHENLEGTQNCTKCHDVGKEIIGTRCLGCHQEIQSQIEAKRGYHFSSIGSACVKCHKEHLGRDAKTTLFDEKTFDHRLTGFTLNGGHGTLKCEQCHKDANIKDPVVQKLLADKPHKSFLGLKQECNSCHADVHKGRFSQSCNSCHTTTTWRDVAKFDHARTKFPLTGSHIPVKCEGCHTAIHAPGKEKQFDFTTKAFTDCTPCHTTPHGAKFADRTCQSCHTTVSWKETPKKGFDHNLTAYKLVGKHALVQCSGCHTKMVGGKPTNKLHMAFKKCTDCHADKHDGAFASKYKNDCAICHTEQGYTPSVYTLSQHNQSHFPLTGSHIATLCGQCHRTKTNNKLYFRYESMECVSCHKDPHKGAFKKVMQETGCGKCHTTDEWKAVSFDHSKTEFALKDKHTSVACAQCHKSMLSDGISIELTKLEKRCESCHKDIHQSQFAISEKTECSTCHREEGWKNVTFNHETQSSFSLTGAHAKVECKACHRSEQANGATFIRFKPLDRKCESCHQNIKN